MDLQSLFLWMDPALIWMYRITGNPVVDFFLGTLLLALTSVVVGEFTISLAFRANRKHIDKLNEAMVDYNNASVEAAKAGDKAGWKQLNKQANDAFGKVFFQQIALSTASLWPAFLALGWMQLRFSQLEFPLPYGGFGLFGGTVGYTFIFILSYILTRILFGKIKYKLPYFRTMKPILDAYKRQSDRLITPLNEPGEKRPVDKDQAPETKPSSPAS
ncbi:hypothetical protein GF324_06655 [bacterium]|nr:hypothetical protein [bacterium]